MRNNRFIIPGAVIVLAIVFLFFRNNENIRNFPPSGRTVVAFGDSLVAGQGASLGNDFVSVVSRQIGIPITNLGQSGDTTETALARIGGALALKPNVVIVLLGGNDALKKVPLEETRRNLSLIIDRFQSTGAIVLLLGVRGGLLGDPYDTMYEELADESGSLYVEDVLKGLFGSPKYMSDAIHPNDAGYAVIADRVAGEFEKIFRN